MSDHGTCTYCGDEDGYLVDAFLPGERYQCVGCAIDAAEYQLGGRYNTDTPRTTKQAMDNDNADK